MYQKSYYIIGLVLISGIGLLNSCATSPAEQNQDLEAYLTSIKNWQEARNESMRDTASWLSLAGLHWLEPGETTFGSDSSNTIIFPPSASDFAGSFILEDSIVKIVTTDQANISHNGQLIREMVLRNDMQDSTTYLQSGSINFYAIRRPEGFAIRVKDSQNPVLVNFEDIPNFEIDPDWNIEAQIRWYEEPKSIQIPTVLGSERTQKCPAVLVFEINGELQELSPYMSFYGDPIWTIIFSDLTNGETTYGGGRFLEFTAPTAGTGSMMIDFNKAYNPPCAFSEFATCPLPPPENRLAIAIPAGEEMYGEMH